VLTGFRIAVAILLGLAFGSFLTVLISRVPAGESILRPRSRCPGCGVALRTADLVPVVSWLALRGRCRSCGARISAVYPLVELACTGLFVAVALVFEDLWQAFLLAPFLGILLALSVIDIRTKKIPNRIVYPSVPVAAIYIVVADLAGGSLDVVLGGLGFLAYGLGLLIVALIAPRGMGMGDVKLAGFIGLVLGSLGLRFVAVAAGAGIVLGGVGAIVALAQGATRKTGIPYGPFMAGGALVACFFGDQIADAYIRLFN
jgi:leader peptidase (prepilin peptidase)/N-methyltransferase